MNDATKFEGHQIICTDLPHYPQSSEFTYQGRLQDGGANANGNYDLQFTLWDSLNGGTQQPQPSPLAVTKSSVVVANGVFTVQIDFGASAFPGAIRFLETSVRLAGSGSYTVLSPRQPISSTPYAVRSASTSSADSATTASNATQLGGVAASQYVITSDSRLSDSRAPTSGSSNYIQNNTSQQASSNFNISGNGTADGTLSGNVITAKTRVGIGTTSPAVTLDVQNNTAAAAIFLKSTAGSSSLLLDRASTLVPNGSSVTFATSGISDFVMGTSQGTAGVSDFSIYNFGTNSNAISIQKSTGNVGIGTTSPTQRLQVQGGGLFTGDLQSATLATSGGVSIVGTLSVGNEITTNNGVFALKGVIGFAPLGNFGVEGSVGGSSSNFDAAYVGKAAVWGTSQSSVAVFGTSDSNVGVVGVSQSNIGVLGRSITGTAGRFEGNVIVTGTLTQGSDARLKQGISNLDYGLAEVRRLRPVTWRWKDHPDRGTQLGLVAQEVEKVLPELVSTDKDPQQTKGINYIGLAPVMIKAIQEQQAQIEQQQELIKQQETQFKKQRAILASQQQQISALKKLVCRTHSRAAVCR